MTAIIPQVPQTGLTDGELQGMFPGVAIVHDATLLPAPPLRGKLKALSDLVTTRLAAGDVEMSYPDLRREMGMEAANFGAVTRKPEWLAWVASMGLVPCKLDGRTNGLQRVSQRPADVMA